MSGTEKQKIKAEHSVATKDLKIISGSVLAAFRNGEKAVNTPTKSAKQGREYWKKVLEYWFSVLEEVLRNKQPDYLAIDVIERAKGEFIDKLNMLRGLEEEGIDIIVEDLTSRFHIIMETTRVNDMSAVKLRIEERIREINTSILIATTPNHEQELKNILKEFIQLNNLIPK